MSTAATSSGLVAIGAVFVSYASQDAEAARRICEALRAAGVEVWFDQSELVGGDAWDQKIRKQIKECALFVPIVSANTQARREGYFRLEWRLAAERMRQMDDDLPFLLPVVIDDTKDAEAFVPEKFREVQWTRLPAGETSPAFCGRVRKLLGGTSEKKSAAGAEVSRSEDVTIPAARRSRWLIPAVAAAVVMVGVAAGVVWRIPRDRGSHEEQRVSAAPGPPAAPDTLSPARQLAERARVILQKGSLSRAQLDTAGDLCKRALELDSTDPNIWAVAANADLLAIHPYGYDRSDERRRRAQERAARAINLGPDLFEVRVIHAAVLAHAVGTPALLIEAEKTLRELVSSHPDDRDLVLKLAEVLREQKRFAEAAKFFERVGEFEVAGWSYFDGGEMRAARLAVDRSPRAVTSVMLKAILQYSADEDLEAAQATVSQLLPSELLDESPAAASIRIALYRRDPERILEIAQGLTRDYMDSNSFRGPRRFYTGIAHELAGRPDQAEIEWRAALGVVETRLKSAPDDAWLLTWAAWLHAALNHPAEAERNFARSQVLAAPRNLTMEWLNFYALLRLGKKEAVLARARALLREKPPQWEVLHVDMRFSAEWDALRGDARFETLLRDHLPVGAKPFDQAERGAKL